MELLYLPQENSCRTRSKSGYGGQHVLLDRCHAVSKTGVALGKKEAGATKADKLIFKLHYDSNLWLDVAHLTRPYFFSQPSLIQRDREYSTLREISSILFTHIQKIK